MLGVTSNTAAPGADREEQRGKGRSPSPAQLTRSFPGNPEKALASLQTPLPSPARAEGWMRKERREETGSIPSVLLNLAQPEQDRALLCPPHTTLGSGLGGQLSTGAVGAHCPVPGLCSAAIASLINHQLTVNCRRHLLQRRISSQAVKGP